VNIRFLRFARKRPHTAISILLVIAAASFPYYPLPALACLSLAIQIFRWVSSPIARYVYKHFMSRDDWGRHNRNIRGVADKIGLGD
jgi:hypothetical protein